MYKTLADLAELTHQEPAIEASVQGTSLARVFDNPTRLPSDLGQKRAFSQIGRCDCGQYPDKHQAGGIVHECGGNACANIPLMSFNYMGYTMRTENARFTAWVPFDNKTLRVDWSPAGSSDGRQIKLGYYNLTGATGRDFDNPQLSKNLAGEPCCQTHAQQLLGELRDEVNKWY